MELDEVKKSPGKGFVRTTSCFGEAQKNAVQCLKNGDLTTFSDLLTDAVPDLDPENGVAATLPDDHWINQPIAVEDDKSLVMLAIEYNAHDFLTILLRSGANANLINKELGIYPLHSAAKRRDLEAMKILVEHGSNIDINTISRSSGQTALHLCADQGFSEGVAFLLTQKSVDVNLKDKKGKKTPIFYAIKAKDPDSVLKLIAHGADLDHVCGGMSLRDHLKSKMPSVNPETIPKERPAFARENSSSVFETLTSIINDWQANDDVETFKSLLVGISSAELDQFRCGSETLLQRACHECKVELASALLDAGIDVNAMGETTSQTPIHIATQASNFDMIKLLVDHNADLTILTVSTEESILHKLLKSNDGTDLASMETIIEYFCDPHKKDVFRQIRKIINKKDIHGNSALHYATSKWSRDITKALLMVGANIGQKNQFGEVACTLIKPETLEEFFDDCIVSSDGLDENKPDAEITFNYSFLAPANEDLPPALKQREQPTAHNKKQLGNGPDPESAFIDADEQEEKYPLPETEALWHLGQSQQHRHLLKHPVVTSFLWFKWTRIRRYFNRNLRFYLLFVFILTWHIFQKFGGKSVLPSSADQGAKNIPFFFGLYIAFLILMTVFIFRDWKKDLEDLRRVEGNIGCKSVAGLIFSNWIEVGLLAFMIFILIGGHKVLALALIALTAILVIREFFQLTVSIRRYLLSPENYIEVTCIILICIIVFHEDQESDNNKLKRILAGIAIVLSWAELITLIGKHPKLTRYNIYVVMFYKVLTSFCYFLLWYAFFIVAFGLAFHIMLYDDNPGEDDYKFFNKPWLSLVKTSTMFVGELEFADLPFGTAVGYGFFLVFVFLIVVVLMNLLNGLAVSDTGMIQEQAEIITYISRVETISYTESVLLGDPFNFLSNWPAFKWLKSVPSLSVCAQIYKNKVMQAMFHKITGATGILLFYSFMPGTTITIKPNEKTGDCMRFDVMDRTIIRSAQKVLEKKALERQQERQDARLSAIEGLLNQLLSKIETLT